MSQENHERDSAFLLTALDEILRHTQSMVFVKDMELVYHAASQAFAQMTGHDSAEDIIGKTDWDIFEDQTLAKAYIADDHRLLNQGKPLISYVEPIATRNGTPGYGSTSKYIIRDDAGKPLGLLGITIDITKEHTARINYQQELEFLLRLRENSYLSVLADITDWRMDRIIQGPCWGDHPPLKPGNLDYFLQNAADRVTEDDDVRAFFSDFSMENAIAMFERGKRGFDLEYRRNLSDRTSHWVREEAKFILDPTNGHLMLALTLQDIDAETRLRDELVAAAEHDALTGLLNRGTTMKRIERYLHNEGATGTHALFMLDLDNFKNVNDTYGHRAGDRVISRAAAAIRSTFREADVVGRIGGDEFFILMKNTERAWIVRKKAKDLLDALRLACSSTDEGVELTCSVGISLYRADHKSLETLYAEADAALYRAKAAGKDRFAYSDTAETD